jgi:hypothetical protein
VIDFDNGILNALEDYPDSVVPVARRAARFSGHCRRPAKVATLERKDD